MLAYEVDPACRAASERDWAKLHSWAGSLALIVIGVLRRLPGALAKQDGFAPYRFSNAEASSEYRCSD